MATRDGKSWLFAGLLLLLAGFFALDHVAWVREDALPELDADSVLHASAMVFGWGSLAYEWNPRSLLNLGTYPPVTHWAAWSALRAFGASVSMMRESQALFAGLLALGSGLLVRRVSGRAAGVAAAAICFTFPTLWAQRSVVMLALPATACLTLAYALLAVPDEPGRWRRALAGGGAMALAALSHTSVLYWLSATFAAQMAVGALGYLRKREGAALHLRDLGLYYTCPAVLGGAWYLASRRHIVEAYTRVHANPSRESGAADLVVFLGWLRDSFLLAPAAWACLGGLVCLPFLWRRSGLLGPLAAGAVGGFCGAVAYPDVHARLFLPLIPFLLVLMALPLAALRLPGPGLLARRWLGVCLAAGVGVAGLWFSVSWRWAEPGAATVDPRDDGALYLSRLEADRSLPTALFTRLPTRWRTHAPPPHRGVWPIDDVVDAVVTELGLKRQVRPVGMRAEPGAPVLLALEPHLRGEMVAVAVALRRVPPPDVLTELPRAGQPLRDCGTGRCFGLYTRPDGGGGPDVNVLRTWPVQLGTGAPSTLVLAQTSRSLDALIAASKR